MRARSGTTESFWGSARDLGLTSIAILTFAGLVYEYAYLHGLGIDFAAVEISPSLSLIAMSKVGVANAPWLVFALACAFALRGVVGTFAKRRNAWAVGALLSLRERPVQAAFALSCALLACGLANGTANRAVVELRNRKAFGVHVTFAPYASGSYPAALRAANASGDLFLVFDTATSLFVLAQKRTGAIAGMSPIGTVYELHKDDVESVQTVVPSMPTGA